MKWLFFSGIGVLLMLFFVNCEKEENRGRDSMILYSDFSDGKDGWQAGFSEYNGDNVEIYELEEGLATLPAPLDENEPAYRISGMNRSDDLFMYLTKRAEGLKPSTRYKGTFTLHIASDARSGGVGAGGAPDENNFYEMNIDKIQQCCTDGSDMVVIGNVANGTEEYVYTLLERTGEFSATTDDDGMLWIIVATDSGFEGKTTLHYSSIRVALEEI
ncbi:hypothetical protein [Parapedobacter tibetensis]|uniref:hypothetical protein n=1 Tax=Parapedobacter tibetensis TaxID=2972951 RepID=UPI00214D14A0|nr:hypothetical protein [Parapedobacter tibetensis]